MTAPDARVEAALDAWSQTPRWREWAPIKRNALRADMARALAAADAVAPKFPSRSQPQAYPLAEWHEDLGAALWWCFPINEAPYCGAPTYSDWPGYHTHWTLFYAPAPLITARVAKAVEAERERCAVIADKEFYAADRRIETSLTEWSKGLNSDQRRIAQQIATAIRASRTP